MPVRMMSEVVSNESKGIQQAGRSETLTTDLLIVLGLHNRLALHSGFALHSGLGLHSGFGLGSGLALVTDSTRRPEIRVRGLMVPLEVVLTAE